LNPSLELKGILFYPAAYRGANDPQKKPEGKIYDYQSTFIIVPYYLNGTERTPEWSVVDALVKKFTNEGAFNHGELCPNSCFADDPDGR